MQVRLDRHQAPNRRTRTLLWAALTVYAFGSVLVSVFLHEPDAVADPTIVWALIGVAVLDAGMSFALPLWLFHNGLKQRSPIDVEDVADPDAEALFRDMSPTKRVFSDPELARDTFQRTTYTPAIIGWALGVSVAMYGILLAIIGGLPLAVSVPFHVVAGALVLAQPPSHPWFRRIFESFYGARLPD